MIDVRFFFIEITSIRIEIDDRDEVTNVKK